MIMHPLTHKINFLLLDYANSYFPPQERKVTKKTVLSNWNRGEWWKTTKEKWKYQKDKACFPFKCLFKLFIPSAFPVTKYKKNTEKLENIQQWPIGVWTVCPIRREWRNWVCHLAEQMLTKQNIQYSLPVWPDKNKTISLVLTMS